MLTPKECVCENWSISMLRLKGTGNKFLRCAEVCAEAGLSRWGIRQLIDILVFNQRLKKRYFKFIKLTRFLSSRCSRKPASHGHKKNWEVSPTQ